MKPRYFPLIPALLTLIMAGCVTVGPDYTQPALPEPKLDDVLTQPSDVANHEQGAVTPESLASWWSNLDDPALTDLVERALDGNLELRQAQSRVRVSRQMLGISRSAFYPHLDGSATYRRSRNSENMVPAQGQGDIQRMAGALSRGMGVAQTASMLQTDPAGALMQVPGQVASWPVEQDTDWESDYYRTGFDAAWELDIFGGNRRRVQAAEADLEATQESLKHVWVSLAGDVAQTYIQLRTYQARLNVAESNLDAQEETLELLESLYQAGLRDELALQQVRYVVENTRASIPQLRGAIEALMNSLAVLTGDMPGELHELLADSDPIPVPTRSSVTAIPANALRQRPDIHMAERQFAAQTARIGEAKSELYPKFVLAGSIGLESLQSSTLFNSGSDAWSIGPAISWPIFHADAIRANIQVQTELQEQYLAAYENALLAAVKEVRDALTDYAMEQERYSSLQKAEDAARNALAVAQDQYKNGLSDFNNVLDAQRSLLAFQDQSALSRGAITTNLVRIYKALGGGWESMDYE